MVHGRWVELYSLHCIKKIDGGQPYESFTSYALRAHKMRSLCIGVTTFDQNLGSKPQNFPWGIRYRTKGIFTLAPPT